MPDSDFRPARDQWIDERGSLCPVPVIALARAARTAAIGTVIVVLADDPAAEFDIPAWCRMTGNEFLGKEFIDAETEADDTAYAVRITTN
jgi:TusA-related sulfurtransferase